MMDAASADALTDAAARALMQAALRTALSDLPGLYAVVLATADGFEVAAEIGQHSALTVSPSRVAALASSLQALGQASLREVGLGGHGSVLIESDSGKLVMIDLQYGALALVLCLIGPSATLAGKMLWAGRRCAASITGS